MKYIINFICGTILTSLTYILGGWNTALQVLMTFIVIDYLSGIGKSYNNGTLNSNKGFKGIIKKMTILAVVAVAEGADKIFGNNGFIRNITIYFLVSNEGISILENVKEMGCPYPKFLLKKLEQFRKTNDEDIK